MAYNFPPGVALETDKGRFFVARDGKRYKINHDRVWDSWRFNHVVKIYDFEVGNPVAYSELGFRDGTFVMDMSSHKVYLIAAGKKREIVNPDLLRIYGLTTKNTLVVSRKEAQIHKDGEVLE